MIPEPVWVLRGNPLRRTRLADRESTVLLARLVEAEREAVSLARKCSEELYVQIGRTRGGKRSVLVALRRDIHNGRSPQPSALSLSATASPAVGRWVRHRERLDVLRAEVRVGHEAALARERAWLAAMLGDEDLRRALALVAPQVDAAARRYRRDWASGGPLGASLLKSERGLLQYVTRAMMRTSPLSRFTAVGLAVPGRSGVDVGEASPCPAISVLSLDRALATYVMAGLPGMTPVEADDDTWVQQPPTSVHDVETGRYSFNRAGEGGGRRVSVRPTVALSAVLQLTDMGPRQLGEVSAGMARLLAIPRSQANRTVLGAIRSGAICTTIAPEKHQADPLTPQGGAMSPDVRAALGTVREGLSLLGRGSAADRGPVLADVRGAADVLQRVAERPAPLPVQEDFVLPPVKITTHRWRSQLDDLAAVVEFESAFDRLHEVRALLTAAFVARFGPGAVVPLCDHAASLVREVYEREIRYRLGGEDGLGPDDGSLGALRKLRESALISLSAEVDRHGCSAEEVRWRPSELVGLVTALPERFRRMPLSYGVLVQPAGNRLIFNTAYAGHGPLYGRFLGPDRELGGTAAQRLAARLTSRYGTDGALVAEDIGLHRPGLNAHLPVLDTRLGAADWQAVRLVHVKDTDRLRMETAEGRELRVISLGGGFPDFHPPPLRIATWLTSGGRLINDLAGRRYRLRDPESEALYACPRLVAGDTVFSRRRWYPDGGLSEALEGPSSAERLLALAAWRARHGIPAEVLIKNAADPRRRPEARERLRQKPHYLDFDSALMTRVLPQALRRRGTDADTLYIEEALPDAEASLRAREWIVEIDRAPGGLFGYARAG